MKRHCLLAALAAVLALAGCKGTEPQSPESVTLSPKTMTLKVGETKTLKYTAKFPETRTDIVVRWESSDTAVATVGSTTGDNCEVTGKAMGKATITFTLVGKKDTCEVTVVAADVAE